MSKNSIMAWSILFLIILVVVPVHGQSNTFENFYDFLNQFQNAPQEEQEQLIQDYIVWQAERGFPAIVNDTHAVFVYYSESIFIGSAKIAGDFNEWQPTDMERLGTYNFFYFPLNAEPTARLDYKFIIDGNWILDPRNPNRVPGGFGDNSELAMPAFEQPTEIIYRKDIPHGTLNFVDTNFSGPNPSVTVYLPPNYNETKSYPTVYFTDGNEYLSLAYAATIIDNIIADQEIEPIIGIFVDPWNQRHEWYNCSTMDYINYLDELVKFIDFRYSTIQEREQRLHLGDSLGGQISAFVGLQRSETFGNIGIHSGAFWDGSSSLGRIGCNIIDQYRNASGDLDLKMWLTAGTYEQTVYRDTQTITGIIEEKNWKYNVTYYHEGHSWGLWRHTLDDMLRFFFPHSVPSIINDTSDPIPEKSQTTPSFLNTDSQTSPFSPIFWLSPIIILKRKNKASW